MITLRLVQGTNDWLAARAHHFCASEASAMLGMSSRTTRTELLRLKKTGETKEFSEWVQKNLLDKGHEVEAKARPIVEGIVGEDLYPVTGATVIGDMKLLASFDGINMAGDFGWENKSRNKEFLEAIREGRVPDEVWPQLEHQAIVGDLEKIFWSVSDGTPEGTEGIWYEPQHERRSMILSGWAQFGLDLQTFEAAEAAPVPVAAPVRDLPAVIYKMDGLKLTSNLVVFKEAAQQLIEDSKKELTTDQHFADQDALNKAFTKAEAAIELVKAQAIGEIVDVDKFCRDLTEISGFIRQARLTGEKRVESRKSEIKYAILKRGKDAVDAHCAALVERIGKPYLPPINGDFAGAMKGKRNLVSMNDAVDTEIARVKIEANAVADKISVNLGYLREHAKDHVFLFADTGTIVLKATDDFATLVNSRIATHKEAERVKAEQAEAAKRAAAEAETKRQAEQQRPAPAPLVTPVPVASVAPAPAAPLTVPLASSGLSVMPDKRTETLAAISSMISDFDANELLHVLNAAIAVRAKRPKAA